MDKRYIGGKIFKGNENIPDGGVCVCRGDWYNHISGTDIKSMFGIDGKVTRSMERIVSKALLAELDDYVAVFAVLK